MKAKLLLIVLLLALAAPVCPAIAQDDDTQDADTSQPDPAADILSDRVATEIFLGTSFARKFDESGKSQGFDEITPLARFSFDTLWGFTDTTSKPWRIHTGLEVTFSAFPTEADAAEDEGTTQAAADTDSSKTFVDYADSFSGRLYAVWQPERWARYTKTSHRKDPERPYDALCWGLFGKVGAISRDTLTANQDSLLVNGQVGISLTHRQTAAKSQVEEKINVFPIRFVEVSYGYFEEFGKQKDAGLVIIDAGFRLLSTGGKSDFYAGIHLAGGQGEDDVRVFAGMLFHLDRAKTLVP